MQKLEITDFGPISTCNIIIKDFMVITGEQASGKSIIAKCIFYFNHLKDILFEIIQRNTGRKPLFQGQSLEELFLREARKIFLQSFGLEGRTAGFSTVGYVYDNGKIISVHIKQLVDDVSIEITLDESIRHELNKLERMFFSEEQSVKLNYASSGQQEAVWITNILIFYILGKRRTLFIVEEPESHLFPEAQKTMVELISLVKNGRNKVVITTHSPYVLGSINNLLYAQKISSLVDQESLNEIFPRQLWMTFESLGAHFLKDGKIEDIADSEYKDIDNDVIDEVSSMINETYEKMVDLKESSSGGEL